MQKESQFFNAWLSGCKVILSVDVLMQLMFFTAKIKIMVDYINVGGCNSHVQLLPRHISAQIIRDIIRP